MIKIFCLLILVLSSLVAKTQPLNIGLIDYPPHIDFDDDIEQSPLYQYINNMLAPAGFTVTFMKLPRERALLELTKGNIDLLLPTTTTIDNKTMKVLPSPLFHSVPGLCFKKENFIPILSATHRLANLTIGAPVNSPLVPALTDSSAKIVLIKGRNAINRGLEMTQRARFDAFYHPSPHKVYHRNNPLYKELACSYFHGYATPIHIAVSNALPISTFNLINTAFDKALLDKSYEYYFASRE